VLAVSVGFRGGPADGLAVAMDRVPFYVRVVLEDGVVVPLDSLEDAPRDDEQLAVYVRPGEVLRLSQPGGRPATVSAIYVHLPDVDVDALRETEAWRAWASAQPAGAGQGRVGEIRWPPPVPEAST
jgi:hypothetical protein